MVHALICVRDVFLDGRDHNVVSWCVDTRTSSTQCSAWAVKIQFSTSCTTQKPLDRKWICSGCQKEPHSSQPWNTPPKKRTSSWNCYPIGSMYAIYANIGGILMGSMLPYIAYMDPMAMKVPLSSDLSYWERGTTQITHTSAGGSCMEFRVKNGPIGPIGAYAVLNQKKWKVHEILYFNILHRKALCVYCRRERRWFTAVLRTGRFTGSSFVSKQSTRLHGSRITGIPGI